MKIKLCYFSPTGATLDVAAVFAENLGRRLDADVEYCSYTLPSERETFPVFSEDDIVIWATPVYAGRIPNKTLDYVRAALDSSKTLDSALPAVAFVTFGNRAYDNALAELSALMQESGMNVVGAAAVVTRHCFSETLGANRPNKDDLASLDSFAEQIVDKIKKAQYTPLDIPGEAHPDKYYTPLKTNNAPAGFLKAKPSCDVELCTRCGSCKDICPMGSISFEDNIPHFEGICIKCQTCRLRCPAKAISFTNADYHSHVAMIESKFGGPKKTDFFV